MVTEGVVSTFLNLLCLRQLTFADHTIATQWVNSPAMTTITRFT